MLSREDLRSELDELHQLIHADVAKLLIPVLQALEDLGSTGSMNFAPSIATVQSTATPPSLASPKITPILLPLEEPPSSMTVLQPPGALAPDALEDSLKGESMLTPESIVVRKTSSASTSMGNYDETQMTTKGSASSQSIMTFQVQTSSMPDNFMPIVTMHGLPGIEAQKALRDAQNVSPTTLGDLISKKQSRNKTCSDLEVMSRYEKPESTKTDPAPESSNEINIEPHNAKGFITSEDAFVKQSSGERRRSKQSVWSTNSKIELISKKRIASASAKRLKRTLSTTSLESIASAEQDGNLLQRRVLNMVRNNAFNNGITGLIITNGVFVGIQTDFLTRRQREDPNIAFQLIDFAFSILFVMELALRLFAFRCSFFTMAQRWWNVFDFIIVGLQLFEMFMLVVASNAGVGFNFNFLRILRLVRVVRLARALRVIGELRTIVSSIAGSVKPLFWTGVLLCLIAYVFGVALTQLVHMKRVELIESNEPTPDHFERYWGCLSVTIFTLIQAITGGIDWDEACRPLMETIGVEVGLLFTFYILFCSLAMLNVVTGVFIEAVMENSKRAKEQCTKQHVENLFTALNVGHSGTILWRDFERYLDRQEMKDFFNIVDVEISSAKRLFELLDVDGSGSIDAGELMDGCLRIWSPAKDLDMRMVSHDICRLRHRIQELVGLVKSLQPEPNTTAAFKLLGG